jgi:hypothetical protein
LCSPTKLVGHAWEVLASSERGRCFHRSDPGDIVLRGNIEMSQQQAARLVRADISVGTPEAHAVLDPWLDAAKLPRSGIPETSRAAWNPDDKLHESRTARESNVTQKGYPGR